VISLNSRLQSKKHTAFLISWTPSNWPTEASKQKQNKIKPSL